MVVSFAWELECGICYCLVCPEGRVCWNLIGELGLIVVHHCAFISETAFSYSGPCCGVESEFLDPREAFDRVAGEWFAQCTEPHHWVSLFLSLTLLYFCRTQLLNPISPLVDCGLISSPEAVVICYVLEGSVALNSCIEISLERQTRSTSEAWRSLRSIKSSAKLRKEVFEQLTINKFLTSLLFNPLHCLHQRQNSIRLCVWDVYNTYKTVRMRR